MKVPRRLRRFLRLRRADGIEFPLCAFMIQIQHALRMMSLRCLHSRTVSDQLFAALHPVALTHIGHGSMHGVPVFGTLRARRADLLARRTLRLGILVVLESAGTVPLMIPLRPVVQRVVIDIRLLPFALPDRRCLADIVDRCGHDAVPDHRWQARSSLSVLIPIVHRGLPVVKTMPALHRRYYPRCADVAHGTLPLLVATVVGFLSQDPPVDAANVRHGSVMPSIRWPLAGWHTARHADVRHRAVPLESLAAGGAAAGGGDYAVSSLARGVFPGRCGSLCHRLAVSSQSDKADLSLASLIPIRYQGTRRLYERARARDLTYRETVYSSWNPRWIRSCDSLRIARSWPVENAAPSCTPRDPLALMLFRDRGPPERGTRKHGDKLAENIDRRNQQRKVIKTSARHAVCVSPAVFSERESFGRLYAYLRHLRVLVAPYVSLQVSVTQSLGLLFPFGRRWNHVFRVSQSFAFAIHAWPESRFLLDATSVPRLVSLGRDLLATLHHCLQLQR